MIDYDATLQNFFTEIIIFLDRLRAKSREDVHKKRYQAAIDVVRRVAANPQVYADYDARVKSGMECIDFDEALMPADSCDDSVYCAYSSVVNSMGNLHSQSERKRAAAQGKLVNALYTMKYKNATNLFNKVLLKVKNRESFAVQSTKQYEI